jgi:hypothetical protein
MTMGTIMGESSTAMRNSFPRNRARTNPRDARVPRTVARMVATTPMMTLFLRERIQASSVKNSAYHFRENPWRG